MFAPNFLIIESADIGVITRHSLIETVSQQCIVGAVREENTFLFFERVGGCKSPFFYPKIAKLLPRSVSSYMIILEQEGKSEKFTSLSFNGGNTRMILLYHVLSHISLFSETITRDHKAMTQRARIQWKRKEYARENETREKLC